MSDIKIPDLNIPTPQNSDAPTNKTVAQEEAEMQAALEAELEAEYIDKRQIIPRFICNIPQFQKIIGILAPIEANFVTLLHTPYHRLRSPLPSKPWEEF